MLELMILAAALGGIAGGYVAARRFVRERLRFVDAIGRPGVAVGVGVAAAVVALPVVAILPVVGAGTAFVFGAGMGLAVSHGARDIRAGGAYLPPGD